MGLLPRKAVNELVSSSVSVERKEEDVWEWDRYVSEYMAKWGGKKITEINETTKKKLKAIIDAGIQRGLGTNEIAQMIEVESDKQGYRAKRISRTEVIAASNYGSLVGAMSTGLDMTKSWLSTRDDETREDHSIADGQTVELNEPFFVGGEGLEWPGDPIGQAGNVINCRCAVTYEVK